MELTGLSIINAQASRQPGPNLLHELVKPSGQQVALDYMGNNERSNFTYDQLHEAAASLAIRITKVSGSVNGHFVVPVLIHQSPSLYISLLAILKAGGAFCPLNVDAPPERVRFILGDVAATVVLVSRELASEIPNDISATVIIVDEDENQSNPPTPAEPNTRIPMPEDLAYVMYTSGSTGTPKGVGISHDAATQALIAHDRYIPPFSRFLQFAAPTFDVSVFEIFFPLIRGATLVSVRRVEMLDDLPGVLRTMQVDACELTPTVAGSLLRKRENAPGLKVLLTIGEMLNAPVVEEFGGDENRPSMLWAMYGPTEATIHCTLQTAFSSDSSTGNIGVPLDTVSCFIIAIPESDAEQSEIRILPQGEVGELAVGGYQLATGYINRPEQTNSVFVDSPFGRIYRTGDKARLLPNGKLECFGRLSDGQVKLRGQRLELGEVEQAVLRTSGCHSAVAAVVRSILVVFCAVDAEVTEDAVLKQCGDWLPQYMVPGELVLMSEFPRLPSGKVDRKKLKTEYEEHKAAISEDTRDSEPVDEFESELLEIVSCVMNFKVNKSTPITAVGMDSLSAIKLASSLRNAGFAIDATLLLKAKTMFDIVFSARRQVQNQTVSSKPVCTTLSLDLDRLLQQNTTLAHMSDIVEDVVPCTPLQAAMLAETSQNPTAYCNQVELSIPKSYSVDQIRESFTELSQKNPILRSGFVVADGRFVTVLYKKLRPEQIRIVDQIQNDLKLSSPQEFCSPMSLQIHEDTTDGDCRVFLQIHHSLYDGWSMDVLLSDWSRLLLQESVPEHPPFREVINFYHTLQTDDAARVFWTEHLTGWKQTPLPKLRDKFVHSCEILSYRRHMLLPRDRVNIEAQKNGFSPQVLFQASLALLWTSVTGARDITIGSVTSGRTISVPGIEQIVGPCIASLPVRVDFDKTSIVLDLLNSLHSSNRKIMQHCTVSLSDIKKLLGLYPAESLYDILFVYQESLTSSERTHNVVKEASHLDRSETPILFEVEPAGDGFILQVTYHESVLSPTTVQHMADQFEALTLSILEGSTQEIKSTLSHLNCIPSIDNVNATPPQEVPDLGRLFEDVVRRSPDADAMLFASSLEATSHTTWSFQELNDRANQIAHYLRSCGIDVGQIVAIAMEKSPTLYASILAIVKCGCGYLPILPSTPQARTRDILIQADIKHCLVDGASCDQIPSVPGLSMVTVDINLANEFPTANLNTEVNGLRLAYVIYTSGTTGTPKGVAIQQQSIVANIAHLEATYPKPSSSQGRLLQACSQAFDVSVFEIFYTWYAGMCLCAGVNDTILEDIERSIRDLGITHLSMTPTVATLVNPSNVPSVELLVTAGEPMTQAVHKKWYRQLWQGYGPSETTNICTVKKMAADDYIEHLGHVFPNTSVVVLFQESLDTVPINWVGEFCFGGAQVAQGYFNMSELTEQKFIQHPQYGRLYRSGDMGRMLPDGSLVILGRIDDQVKLRGQRIEIGEINSTVTMAGFASTAATVLVQLDEDSTKQLALFFVPRNCPTEPFVLEVDDETQRSLAAHLQSRLPGYMVPSYLIPISSMPMTSSGKIDKRRLQACFNVLDRHHLEKVSRSSTDATDEGGWSQMDLLIAEAINESATVSMNDFGRWTSFTLLGIDSISAIDLARVLSSKVAARVAVSDILRNPTVAQLARCLEEKKSNQGTESLGMTKEFFPAAFITSMEELFMKESKTVKAVLPCTPLQEAMLSRGQKGYYNKVLLRLKAGSEEIRSYWETLFKRHDILRTCFATTTDSKRAMAQIVIEEWEIPWRTFDINEPSFDGAIEAHLKSLPDPVDSRTPPVSLGLLRYRGSEFLSFICHHALYDGVAMERLLKEVEALASGENLPPPVSYKEFLGISTDLPEDTEEFWQHHFRDYRASSIFHQSSLSEIDQSTCTTSLDMPLADLHGRLRDFGTTLLSVCQASWATVLAMAYRQSDVCFGNVMSGRTLDIDGLDRLVAPCFNTIPIRVDLPGMSSNIDMVRHLQMLNTELLTYQFTPLRLIQRSINRTGKHIFDTLLLLQKPLQDIDQNVWTLEGDSGDMDIPLVCEVVPCPGLNSLVINLHRDMSTVTEEVATAMADVFKIILKAILATPHSKPMTATDLPDNLRLILKQLEPRHEKKEVTGPISGKKEEWSQVELEVRQVLAKLSGVSEQQIHRRTTIFQLGLDSINAVQVASILRQSGFVISASDVIECPSCSKIAAKLLENGSKTKSEYVKKYDLGHFSRQVYPEVVERLAETATVETILPSTPVQSAMLASFIQSGGEHYLNAMEYIVTDDIPLGDLENAWQLLHKRHPMLRTGFVPIQHADTSFAMVRYIPGSTDTPLSVSASDDDNMSDLLHLKAHIGQGFLAALHCPLWTVVLAKTSEVTSMKLVIHHALYDAPALQLMFDDLNRFVKNEQLPPISRIEPAVSAIMSNSLDDQESEKAFWEAKASNCVVNKFPLMTPLRVENRCVLTDATTASLSFTTLKQATQASDVTIQAVIQAAWTRVLASYLGENSVVFGVALSGRTSDETRDAAFPCLNTVPIVASNVPSNAELVSHMMSYNQHLHKHQFSPLSRVQRWLGHPAGPVFDSLIAYQKMPVAESSLPWKLVSDEARVEYSVSLEVEPKSNDEIRLGITYYDDILPREQAQLLMRQFDASLSHIVSNTSATEDDAFNITSDLYSVLPPLSPVLDAPVQFLHQFVELRAAIHPHKLALEFVSAFEGDMCIKQQWDYRQLNIMGNKVANILHEKLTPGSIVAIHFEKCPEAYFSILGILKAGCSFVALDPSAPKARKQFIVEDSKAPCLLTRRSEDLDFEANIAILELDVESLTNMEEEDLAFQPEMSSSDTCYCLYTSGTTGTPKGCEITHDNAVQAMMAFQELFKGHWDDESRWLQFAALHFDVSVLEQYWSWSVGMAVVAAPKDLILDDLTGSINKLGITHIDLTPSLARLTHPNEVPSLCRGVFITGGEQLKQEILDVWGPEAVIYNAYGPTEATIGVTMFQRVPINGRPSNIGKQFPNVGSFVFKQNTNTPVLRGGVGELCVSGRLVGKGYLNRPQLTEERFPTLKEFGERVYRTGDLVRVLHDGCFEFLGRADDQVKLRGQRLEIAEINHTIRTDVSDIQDAATIVARHGTSGKDVLVAFVVGKNSSRQLLEVMPDEEGLAAKAKEACRAKLPGYMVPTYILTLPYIPLSSNNKAEIKDLKKIFNELAPETLLELSHAASAPVSQGAQNILTLLYEAIAQFSGINKDDLSSTTSIFDVGVDSITALRLAALLRSRGLPAASPARLLQSPVIGDLANCLANAASTQRKKLTRGAEQSIQAYAHRHRGLVCQSLDIRPADIEYIAPCSPLQQGIISRSITSSKPGAYFNAFKLHLRQKTSETKLQQAWKDLVSSESILRTAFVPTMDGFLQVALRNAAFPWVSRIVNSNEELGGYLEEQKATWIRRNESLITQPFLLTFVQTPTSRLLVVYIFHALYDGNSFNLMMDKLAANYAGVASPQAPSFFEALTSGPLSRHNSCRSFWEKHLDGWVPSPITRDENSTSDSVAVAEREMSISSLEAIRSSQNVTLQAVVMALWTSVLQNMVQNQVTVGVVVSGRAIDLPGVEHTIGPLFNTVPFNRQSVPHENWKSLVRRCHDFNASVLDFQHIPLKDIQKWCSHNKALFDNLFTYQIELDKTNGHELPFEVEDSETTPDYPLALEAVYTQQGRLRLTLVAQGHVTSSSGLHHLLSEIERFAHLAANSPESEVPVPEAREISTSNLRREPATEDTQSHFEWTPEAQGIRNEISHLTDIIPEDIAQDISILELGLDSIDVIKLAAKLKKRGINLTPSQMMRHQTIARMVTELTSLAADSVHLENEDSLARIKDRLHKYLETSGMDMKNVESVLPPTHLQESMIAGMVQSDFESYFNHDILRISNQVETAGLVEAWQQLIHQTPILRTGFVQVESQDLDMTYCQVVHKSLDIDFDMVEMQDLDELRQVTDVATAMAKGGQGEKHLFQLRLASVGQARYLVLSMSHALYDGWSLSIMFQDLNALLEGRSIIRPPVEPFITRVLHSTTRKAQEFWTQYLEDASSSVIATRALFPAEETAAQRFESVSTITLSDIDTACKRLSVSLQVLCQACWSITLARQIKSTDVTFGTVLSGRDFDGAESLVFPTMNTVALRCILHGSTPEFLRYMEENMTDIRDFQHYPLSKAQSAAKIHGRDLFNTLFILQRSPASRDPMDHPLLTSIEGSSATEYPLCLEAEPVSDSLVWRLAIQPQCNWDGGAQSLFETLDNVMSFLMKPNAPEILSFGDHGVSICGTSPIVLRESMVLEHSSIMELSTDDKMEWSQVEEGIRDVLHQVSNVPISSIKHSDNLYHLGLDSITAIKVSSLLRIVDINIRPQDLIRSSSISEMARKAKNKPKTPLQMPETDAGWSPPADIDINQLLTNNGIGNEDVEVVPALPMQVYMLTVWQRSNGSVFFPEFPCRINTSAGIGGIRDAWSKLVSEKPLLRTCFIATKSPTVPFVQVIMKNLVVPLTEAQVGEEPNCRTQPLIAASIQQEDHDTWFLRLKLHHALYDGVSLPALLQRFSELLNGATTTDNIGLSHWKQFAMRYSTDAARMARQEFWTSYLKGAYPNPIIVDPETDVTMRTSHLNRSAISDISQIQILATQSGISFQSLFLSAYARALANRNNVSEVVFGMYLANRAAGEDLPQSYPTLNLVPLRVNYPNRPLVAVAADIQRDIHQITSNGRADVGLWEIAQWTGVKVTSFVNFLSLSSDADSATNSVKVLSERDADVAGHDCAPDPFEVYFQENIVRNDIPMAIDIEASIDGKNLSIGAFGSQQQISHDEAVTLVDSIARTLSESS
ncbi:non-ribosomal peptide synthetase nps2 [Fusarium equiseti]|uniref:Non-ribosomal peptide synthetase nps2 n=1 Tax=Fusarium equiseti TaxID=61235 RepID=A0ABQ8RM32_FUSEQ|nr:non-ribosomal peptide synthetase nps2 [Fusarium equiseti]